MESKKVFCKLSIVFSTIAVVFGALALPAIAEERSRAGSWHWSLLASWQANTLLAMAIVLLLLLATVLLLASIYSPMRKARKGIAISLLILNIITFIVSGALVVMFVVFPNGGSSFAMFATLQIISSVFFFVLSGLAISHLVGVCQEGDEKVDTVTDNV